MISDRADHLLLGAEIQADHHLMVAEVQADHHLLGAEILAGHHLLEAERGIVQHIAYFHFLYQNRRNKWYFIIIRDKIKIPKCSSSSDGCFRHIVFLLGCIYVLTCVVCSTSTEALGVHVSTVGKVVIEHQNALARMSISSLVAARLLKLGKTTSDMVFLLAEDPIRVGKQLVGNCDLHQTCFRFASSTDLHTHLRIIMLSVCLNNQWCWFWA